MPQLQTTDSLTFTGERLVTHNPRERMQMVYEHLHRYHLAAELCTNKVALDIACGEGYGSHLLSQRAKKVIGVDIAPEVIRHAANKYQSPKIKFLEGSCLELPVPDQSVDVVVSFETIEHISGHKPFLREIRRVLNEAGILVISTPDKGMYTDKLGNKNAFHQRELHRLEFFDLLQHNFKHCLSLGQRVIGGSLIALDGSQTSQRPQVIYGSFVGDFETFDFTPAIRDAIYCIAVCSNSPLPAVKVGVLESTQESAHIWNAFESASRLTAEKVAALQANEQARRELDSMRLALADRESRWNAESANLAKELEQSLAENQKTLAKRAELEAIVRERERSVQNLEEAIRSLKEAAERAENYTRENIETLASDLKQKTALAEQLNEELKISAQSAARFAERTSQLDLELSSLRTELAVACANVKSSEAIIEDLRASRDKLTSLAAAMNESVQEKDALIQSLATQNESLTRASVLFRERVALLELDLSATRLQVSETEDKLAAAQNDTRALEVHSSNLAAEKESLVAETSRLQAKLLTVEAAHAESRDSLARLDQRLRTRSEELDGLRTLLVQSEDDRAKLESTIVQQRSILAQAEMHRSQVEMELRSTSARIAELESEHRHQSLVLNELESQLASAQVQQTGLIAEGRRAIGWASTLDSDLNLTRATSAAEIERLRDKVRRMESSFSWRVTAPLRAVRRKLLD